MRGLQEVSAVHDHILETDDLALHVAQGLSRTPKSLSSQWLYDDAGSALFQRIMALPEYYLSRAEAQLLLAQGERLAGLLAADAPGLDLIELGSGDGSKTRLLCQHLLGQTRALTYRPMDISDHALSALRTHFAAHLPQLDVQPLCGDYFTHWPERLPHRRQVALFMGSNLGNFRWAEALDFLTRIRQQLQAGDRLVLGLDLVKDPRRILAAYNDAAGVTAAFNLNLLRRLNRELGMDFQLGQFAHYPTYDPLDGVARSYLVSTTDQQVRSSVLQRSFTFAAGESLYLEQSQKYTPAQIGVLARDSGFSDVHCITDGPHQYTLAVLAVAGHTLTPTGHPL